MEFESRYQRTLGVVTELYYYQLDCGDMNNKRSFLYSIMCELRTKDKSDKRMYCLIKCWLSGS
jgi:hypothetical protein